MLNMLNLLSMLKGGGAGGMLNNLGNFLPNQQQGCSGNNCNLNMPNYNNNQTSYAPTTPANTQNNSNAPYPYGEFPVKYTKQGQAELKENINKGYNPYYNVNNNVNQTNSNSGLNNIFPNQQNQNAYTQQSQNGNYGNNGYGGGNNGYGNNNYNASNGLNNNGGGNFNGNGGGGGFGNLDINALLPLLTGGKGGASNDMMKNFLPLLSKGGNFNQSELINLISKNINKSSIDEVKPKPENIDDYKKI